MSIAPAAVPVAAVRRSIPMFAAIAAAVLLVANAVIALIAPDQMDDHSAGLGRLSEGLAGFSFVAGAIGLAALTPRGTLVRVFWVIGVLGLLAVGLIMLAVVVTTVEAPEGIVLAVVGLAVLGLIAVAIIGIKRGIWPWWVGVPVALLIPIMFLIPFNSVIMAAIWVLVAWRARMETPASGQ